MGIVSNIDATVRTLSLWSESELCCFVDVNVHGIEFFIAGLVSMMLSFVGFAALVFLGYPVSTVYKNFMKIATSAVLFSYLLSVLLYIKSLTAPSEQLAANSGET